MLTSRLHKHLKCGETARIRQRVVLALSSSTAKDETDSASSSSSSSLDRRTQTPPSPSSSSSSPPFSSSATQSLLSRLRQKSLQRPTIDSLPRRGANDRTKSIMSKFFENPQSNEVPSFANHSRVRNDPTVGPTFDRDRLRLRKTEGTLLGGLFSGGKPNPQSSSPTVGGKSSDPPPGKSFLVDKANIKTLPARDSSRFSSASSNARIATRSPNSRITDISELRQSLFGGKAPNKDSSTNTNSEESPLSEILAAMRRSKDKLRQEQDPTSASFPKWRQQWQQDREAHRQDMQDVATRLEERVRSRMAGGNKNNKSSGSKAIQIPSRDMDLAEISQLFRVSTNQLRKRLMAMGELSSFSANTADESILLQTETIEYIALELGLEIEKLDNSIQSDEAVLLQRRASAAEPEQNLYESLPPRAPVVTIMGHVDHGKTTLMDCLRRRAAGGDAGKKDKKSKKKKNKDGASRKTADGDVSGTEAGGITQVISAFQVPLPDVDIGNVTFLDTPGHAAFKAMRQSGSDAADVIVLVVAADDGISAQTIEIIEFYKSIVRSSNGGISMMVALNKIDKPGINVVAARAMVEGQLLEHGIVPEGLGSESEYGPPVQLIPVSGLTGEGIDELIAGIVLQSEVMDLRADADARAEGVIMDARVEKGLGVVADCIIRWGSISKGDVVVSGVQIGKVRILRDVADRAIKKGIPSQPVRIVGFEEIPRAGDPFICMASEEEAKELIERRRATKETEAIMEADGSTSASQAELQSAGKHLMSYEWRARLEDRHGIVDNSNESQIRIPVVLRADADGSLAALRDSLVALGEESSHDVIIDPIQTGIGPVVPADVELAKESNAAIICFNVKNEIVKESDGSSIQVVSSEVIYSILEEAKVVFGSYLPPIPKETVYGRAKVAAIFNIGGLDTVVAGLQVTDGTLYRDKIPRSSTAVSNSSGKTGSIALYRVIRNGQIIEATAKGLPSTSLKHFKEDVTEIGHGKECGLSLANFNDIQEGDEIECWSKTMEYQTL